ncbi:protein farnesyltransferase subunit beta [Anthonomus grandis grandis]|uniref:protein farnesyltransferase subunit beta n=1 Tax=Anthonomus grandis grandis TaxID=2921223 RepID=UPI00216511C9|nr:protein farnesyltransferase subunit beta [Anthonomus grandis grandis]
MLSNFGKKIRIFLSFIFYQRFYIFKIMEGSLELRNINDIRDNRTEQGIDSTKTTQEQIQVENTVLRKYEEIQNFLRLNPDLPELTMERHRKFLRDSLIYLSSNYECLDASRPWLCYWILHALTLLGERIDENHKSSIAKFLGKCQSPLGGFGGGPGQYPHLAPTYAAVNALVILGTEEAFKLINRDKLYKFLQSVRQPDGSFAMHVGGEIDIRGAYCALSVASMTNIITPELVDGTAEWIVSCQTYEGGFAGCPSLEAHGGYAFCGLAGLVILNKGHLCDKQALLRWLVQKQMKLEGGFQGRTNKLVDSCYSFWQGGAFPLIYSLLAKDGRTPKEHLFDARALQEYILICCQHPQGGIVDKPGKPKDAYHTCYALSGLSIAQHFINKKCVLGSYRNELAVTHPLYNVRPDFVRRAILYFLSLKSKVLS